MLPREKRATIAVHDQTFVITSLGHDLTTRVYRVGANDSLTRVIGLTEAIVLDKFYHG